MKIYKGILDALKIESVYVISDECLYMCFPMEIEDRRWTVSCDSEFLKEKIQLKVSFRDSFIYFNADIEKKEQDSTCAFIYEVLVDEEEKRSDNQKIFFFMMLHKMEEDCKEWNRRKEERYEIGLDEKRIEEINFKAAEHVLVTDKKQLPCMVNNISYSGAKITTMEGRFEINKRICLCLAFVNPIEKIALIGIIRNCHIKTTKDGGIISVLSLEFMDIPYEYSKRIQLFIKKITEDRK